MSRDPFVLEKLKIMREYLFTLVTGVVALYRVHAVIGLQHSHIPLKVRHCWPGRQPPLQSCS
ncbi:hypothetical protein NVIE_1068 [Nitrososphaera viennensis EN76]|uniref:Uncharacterized protein n=1 Tax=Nitrososphaera viennensis EN76 TaxID=926571 RepID=A0A060HF50_9ARCH|nr:hypothetical protein NVIE_1068 [Nitrososphaera viennensis EN76]